MVKRGTNPILYLITTEMSSPCPRQPLDDSLVILNLPTGGFIWMVGMEAHPTRQRKGKESPSDGILRPAKGGTQDDERTWFRRGWREWFLRHSEGANSDWRINLDSVFFLIPNEILRPAKGGTSYASGWRRISRHSGNAKTRPRHGGAGSWWFPLLALTFFIHYDVRIWSIKSFLGSKATSSPLCLFW